MTGRDEHVRVGHTRGDPRRNRRPFAELVVAAVVVLVATLSGPLASAATATPTAPRHDAAGPVWSRTDLGAGPATNVISTTTPIAGGSAFLLGIDEPRSRVFVAAHDHLYGYDFDGHLVQDIAWTKPLIIRFALAGSTLYAFTENGELWAVDLTGSNAPDLMVSGYAWPGSIAVSGQYVVMVENQFPGCFDDNAATVVQIDRSTKAVHSTAVDHVACAKVAATPGVAGLAILAGYHTNAGVLRRIDLGSSGPSAEVVTGSTVSIPSEVDLGTDGAEVYVTGGGTVSEVDAATLVATGNEYGSDRSSASVSPDGAMVLTAGLSNPPASQTVEVFAADDPTVLLYERDLGLAASTSAPVASSDGDRLFLVRVGSNGTTADFVAIRPFETLGGFHPLDPARLLDTRTSNGGHPTKVGPDETLDLAVAGRGGVPATGATAVALNVTVTAASQPSFLTVFPSDVDLPDTSSVNFSPGQTVANMVMGTLGDDGHLSIHNQQGAVDVVVDVTGWYDDSELDSSRYHELSPVRILDTRTTNGVPAPQPVGPGQSLPLQVTGRGGVPASGVSAVIANVTVTDVHTPSFLTAYPHGLSGPPTASNLNYVPGLTVPNLVTVKVGTDGKVDLFNQLGSVNVIVDVVGWFDADGSGTSVFEGVEPFRALDTRDDPGSGLGGGETGSLDLGVDAPEGTRAVVINVTNADSTDASFVTVFPHGGSVPTASNLNFAAGAIAPNLVVVPLGAGGLVDFYNQDGYTELVVDIVGYYVSEP